MMSVPKQQFKTPQLPINTPGSPARGVSLFSAAEDHDHGVSPGVTGSGVAGQVAFWDGASSITGDTDLTFLTDTLTATKLRAATDLGVGIASVEATLHTFGTGFPLVLDERSTVSTAVRVGGSVFQSTSTGDMADGFGTDILFAIEDTAAVRNFIAKIGAVRDGADDTGSFVFDTYNAGTPTERFRIGPSGQWGIGGANYGTAGQYKRSAGVAAAPTWATIPLSEISPRDHSTLTSLVAPADDHTQYVLSAGRLGGQIVIGGTDTTDDLTLRTTAGVGAAGADMIFQVGNNGATEAMRILNSGFIGIGLAAPNAPLHIHGTNNPLFRISHTGGGTGFSANVDAADNAAFVNGSANAFMSFSSQAGASGGLAFSSDGGTSHTFWVPASTNNIIIGAINTSQPGAGSRGLVFSDETALSSMASNTAGLYADDVGGTVRMFAIDEANDKVELGYADKWGHSLMLGGM